MAARKESVFPAPPPETIAGIMLMLDRQAAVTAGLQEQAGQATISMASLDRQMLEFSQALEHMRRLLTGGDGQESLMFRTTMLEKGQLSMAQEIREHREMVEKQLSSIAKSHDEQLKLEREDRDQRYRLLLGFLVQALLAGAAIVFALVKR